MLAEKLADVAAPTARPPRRSSRAVPRPFVKWVGGKTQLIKRYTSLMPKSWNRYYEPFVGGGAMYFHFKPERAVLNDVNAELANCYGIVRDEVEELIEVLHTHVYDKDHYYSVREQNPDDLPAVHRAARTIFLNRTGFNGLYRVNKKGLFNVPFGRYTDPTICDERNLRACNTLLAGVEFRSDDFERATRDAQKGDFVYLDPPYAPVSPTSDFTAYAAGGFDFEDQMRLKDMLAKLDRRGVKFMLSNSDASGLRALYERAGWQVQRVRASRAINSKTSRRGKVYELVVRNY
jgi:DNA adenine methylase